MDGVIKSKWESIRGITHINLSGFYGQEGNFSKKSFSKMGKIFKKIVKVYLLLSQKGFMSMA